MCDIISLMRLYFLVYFMTLVGFSAGASPDSSVKLKQLKPQETESKTRPQIELEPVQKTEVSDNLSQVRRTPISDSSTNLALGIFSGELKQGIDSGTAAAIGIQKSWYTLDETAYEAGLGLYENKVVAVDFGFKKLCCFSYPASPYYKLGFAGLYNARSRLGNFIDYTKYFLEGSVGFENLYSIRHRLRFEIGARYGSPGFHSFAQLLIAFPD